MFRALITPLTARFDLSPQFPPSQNLPPTQDDDDEAEDFARDVLVQLMRNSVESLKDAEDLQTKKDVLSEIERIMLQDACTKPVFQALDGFLLLMSTLSALPPPPSGPVVEPKEQVIANVLEVTRLAFKILAEGLRAHDENMDYFKTQVGYNSFTEALSLLVSDPDTSKQCLSLFLAFTLNDFTLCDIFASLQGADYSDSMFAQFDATPRNIAHPEALPVLWSLYLRAAETDSLARYGFFKILERLCNQSHRNHAILSSLDLLKRTFEHFYNIKADQTGNVVKKERQIVAKLLRKLLELGAGMSNSRVIFQKAIQEDQSLDADVLEVIRAGMKSRWPQHFSLESGGFILVKEESMRGLPHTGLTFMTWLWVEKLPPDNIQLFSVDQPSRQLLRLSLLPSGRLQLECSASKEPLVFENAKLSKGRWAHIAFVFYPHRSSNPTVRLFIDGVMSDTLNWTYPKADYAHSTGTYTIGDDDESHSASWCFASVHFLSTPIGDFVPRLVHHLGMRYTGNFQDPTCPRFLTYEAATSLNMYLVDATARGVNSGELSQITKGLSEGLGIADSALVFSLFPVNFKEGREVIVGNTTKSLRKDAVVVQAACLDTALWTIGGSAVALRLVQLAKTQHELSRTIGILTDGLRSSWQNSEDLERLRGYEIFAEILRHKHELINMTGFETIFEFLGMNFKKPDQSTVVNLVGYKAIALDFELWSRTRAEVQREHLEHFVTLLQVSRYKQFNAKRLCKIGLTRKLLFVLQTDWCQAENQVYLIEALKACAEANFSKEDVIKPLVSYLAANLHDDIADTSSPRSVVSQLDVKGSKVKAERVLEVLISLLSQPALFNRFSIALPPTRICLLLLGDRPSPRLAEQILFLISICLCASATFTRKFELVSGWSVLKTVLPSAWDSGVNKAAFDILMGQTIFGPAASAANSSSGGIACPSILPSILGALHTELGKVADGCSTPPPDSAPTKSNWTLEHTVESMIEQLMSLHTSLAQFRQLFRSQQITETFISAYKSFTQKLVKAESCNPHSIRILEKLNHLGMALALDTAVSGMQKRDILDTLQIAEGIVNPVQARTTVDAALVGDNRTVRQRFASARFSMHVGERTVLKTITRIHEWKRVIKQTERKRLRKMTLDLKENNRQVSKLQDWAVFLTSERGLWPRTTVSDSWRLDETEGPHRIRKKLEPYTDLTSITKVEKAVNMRNIEVPDSDAQSINQLTDVPPWAEAGAYEISTTDMEDRQLMEDVVEDKHRRVRHELEPGDIIEAVTTVARVSGVDSSPGLLIFGKTNVYMLDGLVEGEDGEIIDALDSPRKLFFVPGSIVELDSPQRAQRWTHEQIAAVSEKTFLFRDVALEIYFKDSRSLLIVFLDAHSRREMQQRLTRLINEVSPENIATPGYMRTPLFRSVSAKVLPAFKEGELSTAQRKWQAREISNFTYLCILNQLSGRTPSDATQYPVFPWVVQDYTSTTLDLKSPETYRDLSKPMGAMTEARRQAAESRYTNLESVDEPPFHYGTHFSSSMIVCHFLIRMAPFTHMFKTLQGGDWDLPDRLFSDIARAYESAAVDIRGDVRELIPEFFTCPEFLENSANLDFGVQQTTGEKIHDVKLPPWAKQDPLLFVLLNRQALESDYVSEHLPAWIDLIWGCKQRDTSSLNVFHPLSYEGSIDLESITDELEREATVGIIHNFGQTPRKLFTSSHPERFMHGLSTLPIGTLHGIEEDFGLLSQNPRPIKDLGEGLTVQSLVIDTVGERIIPCPARSLVCPSGPHEQIQWDAATTGSDQLRTLVDNKVAQVIEYASITCSAFADSKNLVTGCADTTVRLWKVGRGSSHMKHSKESAMSLSLSHIMRIHTGPVVCVTACRVWSMVVSGSSDGSAALWDLNRGVYVRSIRHEGGMNATPTVHLVAVNESTGFIATCSREQLCLHTINASPIAKLDLTTTPITSLAFHEREWSRLGILATGAPDGTITLRTWNTDKTPEKAKAQWEFVTLRTLVAKPVRSGEMPSITALKFLGESLCHGEDTGKAYIWTLPD